MSRAYVSAGRKIYVDERSRSASASVIAVAIAVMIFIAAASFVMSAHRSLNDDLMVALEHERHAQEINMKLKTELAAITQTRLMELKASERLGLKRAKEEEVLVLR